MLEGCIPWPEEIARNYREKGYWEDITLNEMLEQAASINQDKTAIVYQNQRLTYADITLQIDRLACRLLELGLKDRDRVVFQLPNSPELVIAFFALIRVGVIPIMALPAHRHTEMRHFINFGGATACFTAGIQPKFDYREMMIEIAPDCPTLKQVFVLGEAGEKQVSIQDLLLERPKQEDPRIRLKGVRPDPNDVALMLLSGGTTALPKLIPRTHNDYVYNAKRGGEASGFAGQTKNLLMVLPMAHNYNIIGPGFLGALAHGGKVVIAPDHQTETLFSLIEEEQIHFVPLAPPLAVNWLNSDIHSEYDFSSLKSISSGGAKLLPDLRKKLEERFDCIYQEIYGTAEGLINCTSLDDPEEVRMFSSGRPICPGDEIKVIDTDGNTVEDGQQGELVVRGPYTINGYYNAPAKNLEAFTDDGFYRLGDMVRIENGNIYYEDRINDLINRGGEKISCDEVESLIMTNSKVENVSLVAIPDPVYGEKACAFVVVHPGETLDFQELTEHLLSCQIAKFKLPERLEIVDKFPLSPAGKILKRELRDTILADEESN